MYEGVDEDAPLCRIRSADGFHIIQISKNLWIGEGSVPSLFDC